MIPNKNKIHANQTRKTKIYKSKIEKTKSCDYESYKPFEEKLEEVFKRNNTKFDSTNFNLEKS